ncbi:hypothetical protein OS242_16430 [Tumebacillus sp. DT12]|uniref:Uncharacterized protein n=1 Tax=Tumebacillus lacus TaxID=2995335 RepID=A0ABT3X7B7_9BACL|nr:hypothetical protein [Tumebacillus lacus]MCX7571536.1 hypothetical protein [Tumebacillus lacus]
MGVVSILAIMLLLLVAFAVVRHHLHPQEVVTVWFACAAVLATAFDACTPRNSNYFKLSDEPHLFLVERILEVVMIPVLLLLYLNLMLWIQSRTGKVAATVGCYALLLGLEALGAASQAFCYVQYQRWWSLILWAVVMLMATAIQKGIRGLLRREGVTI